MRLPNVDGKFPCSEYDPVMEKDKDEVLSVDFEDGKSFDMSGAEIYELIPNSNS